MSNPNHACQASLPGFCEAAIAQVEFKQTLNSAEIIGGIDGCMLGGKLGSVGLTSVLHPLWSHVNLIMYTRLLNSWRVCVASWIFCERIAIGFMRSSWDAFKNALLNQSVRLESSSGPSTNPNPTGKPGLSHNEEFDHFHSRIGTVTAAEGPAQAFS